MFILIIGTTKFKTLEEIQFVFDGKVLVIPAGFISDGMSVPRLLWGFISPQINAQTLHQSICHDFLFEYQYGFWKANWWYFKSLHHKLHDIKRILILLRTNSFSVG